MRYLFQMTRTAFCTPHPVRKLTLTHHALTICPQQKKPTFTSIPQPLRHTICSSATPPPTTEKPTASSSTSSISDQKSQLTLLYDGDCPLCLREVDFLRNRSSAYGNSIAFVDIASPDYDPASNGNISYETAMGRIHAIDSSGEIIVGVPVFRKAYEAVGLGWVYSITSIPPVGWLADKIYDIWADKRLPLTGRPPLEVVAARRAQKGNTCRSDDQ